MHAVGRHVKVKAGVRGFLEGSRFVTPADPPFMVSDYRAAELLKLGLIVPCAAIAVPGPEVLAPPVAPIERAQHPAAAAERATGRRQGR